ncbi:hypothetical protein HC256_008165 [Beauveria bassiana]|nr:hypothetical protein HC256_008165 [Beauveria bassiana]
MENNGRYCTYSSAPIISEATLGTSRHANILTVHRGALVSIHSIYGPLLAVILIRQGSDWPHGLPLVTLSGPLGPAQILWWLAQNKLIAVHTPASTESLGQSSYGLSTEVISIYGRH